jgi:superkiller protein 3
LRSLAKFALVLMLISTLWTTALAQDLTVDVWLNEGHELRESGHYEEALGAYERAIQLDPESADGWMGKGDVLKALFKNDSDLSAPPEAVGYDLYYADYWSWRATTLSTMRRVEDARGAYEVAVELYDERLQENPEDIDSWLNKGKALTNLAFMADFFGDGEKNGTELNEEALLAYDRAIELDPQNSRAWSAKGMALSDESERLGAYDEAIKLDPENVEAWTYRGFALVNLAAKTNNDSLYEEVVASYDKALEVEPDPRTWMDKGHLLLKMGRSNESLEAFDRAIELTPANETSKQAYFWRVKAVFLDGIDRPTEAADAYNETLRLYGLNPEDSDAWSSSGYILIRMGRYDEAADALDRAIELIPTDDTEKLAFFWLKKAFALEAMNRSEEAEEAYDKVLELNPEDPRGWRGRAGGLLNLGKNEEALAAYERVIDLNPPQSEILIGAWSGKARALKALDRYDEALEALDKVIELGFVPFFATEEKGDLFMELERYDEALVAYQAAIDLYPLEGRFWQKKGLVLEAMGRGSEAEISFAMARELGYETPPASSLALTNVVSVGDDQFIEMTNSGTEAQTFEGLILTIDGLKSIILPSFTLGPGEKIRFHLGAGESNERDIFLDGDLALDDVAGNLTIEDSSGNTNMFAAYWTPEVASERWIEMGRELQRVGSYEEALDALNNATDIDPEDPGTWRLKGLILMNLGRDEEALSTFEEAIYLDAEDGYTWYLKGDLLQNLGREREAEVAFSRAEELGFTSPLGGMLAITEISATGEDEFVEIANHLEEAANLNGWTLVVDGDETRSVVLPEYILEPEATVRVHFGAGEGSGTDVFMESGITLNDDSTSVSLRDGAGREVSFLGFERLPDGGVVMVRGSG